MLTRVGSFAFAIEFSPESDAAVLDVVADGDDDDEEEESGAPGVDRAGEE